MNCGLDPEHGARSQTWGWTRRIGGGPAHPCSACGLSPEQGLLLPVSPATYPLLLLTGTYPCTCPPSISGSQYGLLPLPVPLSLWHAPVGPFSSGLFCPLLFHPSISVLHICIFSCG